MARHGVTDDIAVGVAIGTDLVSVVISYELGLSKNDMSRIT